jgi:hypothetical protein
VTIFFRVGLTIPIPGIPSTTDAPPPELSAEQDLDLPGAGQDLISSEEDGEDEDWQDDAGRWEPAVGDAVTVWPIIDESGKSVGYLVAPAGTVSGQAVAAPDVEAGPAAP